MNTESKTTISMHVSTFSVTDTQLYMGGPIYVSGLIQKLNSHIKLLCLIPIP